VGVPVIATFPEVEEPVKLAVTPAGNPMTITDVAPVVLKLIVLVNAVPRQTACESFAGLEIVMVGLITSTPPITFWEDPVHPPTPVTVKL
jgi:hypothetical protein